jgi:uncharacterized protein (TIGR00162 family)
MDKPFFRELSHPELEKPIFVEGLPGFGNIGKIVTRRLIKFTHAKPFSELYSPFFPDYIMVNDKAIFRLPRYEFYASQTRNHNFIILTGDVQPSLNDVTAHYELCGEILKFADKWKPSFIVTIGGVPTQNPEKEVYVAATSAKLAAKITKKGALTYGNGRIMGATGLLLGLAKNQGHDGICLLGTTNGVKPDEKAGSTVFKFFMEKILDIKIKAKS